MRVGDLHRRKHLVEFGCFERIEASILCLQLLVLLLRVNERTNE